MLQKVVSIGVGVAIIGVAGVWIYDRVHMIRLRERMLQEGIRPPSIAATPKPNDVVQKPTAGT